MINGNMIGIGSAPLKTLSIIDENNNEYVGIVVGSEVLFTATDNDVREGLVYASDGGVSIGTKNIPSYHTVYGSKLVPANKELIIMTEECNYNNLFVTIATYNASIQESTLVMYTSINGGMYAAGSNERASDITVDEENAQINLGLTTTEKSVVRYLVTREEF